MSRLGGRRNEPRFRAAVVGAIAATASAAAGIAGFGGEPRAVPLSALGIAALLTGTLAWRDVITQDPNPPKKTRLMLGKCMDYGIRAPYPEDEIVAPAARPRYPGPTRILRWPGGLATTWRCAPLAFSVSGYCSGTWGLILLSP